MSIGYYLKKIEKLILYSLQHEICNLKKLDSGTENHYKIKQILRHYIFSVHFGQWLNQFSKCIHDKCKLFYFKNYWIRQISVLNVTMVPYVFQVGSCESRTSTSPGYPGSVA